MQVGGGRDTGAQAKEHQRLPAPIEARRGLEQSSLQPTHTSALSPIQNDFRSGPAVEGGKEARWIASLAFASGVLRYLVSQVQIALVLEGLKAGSNFLFHLCLP